MEPGLKIKRMITKKKKKKKAEEKGRGISRCTVQGTQTEQ